MPVNGAAQTVNDCDQQLDFFTRADQEQELITVTQEETKHTEEKVEAGYRPPTWSILRALQAINKAKRLEGEAVMSAPAFWLEEDT